jgi:hypothetical protein
VFLWGYRSTSRPSIPWLQNVVIPPMTLVPFPPVTSPSDDSLDSIEARDAAAAELFGQLADTDSPEGREEIVGPVSD